MNIKKQKIKEVLLEKEWGTGILVPIILGLLVFFLVQLFDGRLSLALFWSIFTTYIVFGGFISVSKSFSGKFEIVNSFLGIAILVFGIIILTLWSEIKVMGTPVIIAGITIALFSFLGWLTKKLDDGLSYLDNWY